LTQLSELSDSNSGSGSGSDPVAFGAKPSTVHVEEAEKRKRPAAPLLETCGWARCGTGEWTAGKVEKVLRTDENLKPETLLLRQ
jgi:hypothetical protein